MNWGISCSPNSPTEACHSRGERSFRGIVCHSGGPKPCLVDRPGPQDTRYGQFQVGKVTSVPATQVDLGVWTPAGVLLLETDKTHSKAPAEAFANSLTRAFCLIWAVCSSTLEDPYEPWPWPLSWQLQPGCLSWVWLVPCQPYQAEATRSPQPKRIHAYQCPPSSTSH